MSLVQTVRFTAAIICKARIISLFVNPMKLLIKTYYGDTHAHAVAWALRRKGHKCVLWHVTDFPSHASISFSCDGQSESRLKIENEDGDIVDIADFDLVWNRRGGQPSLIKNLAKGDVPYAIKECKAFLEGFISVAATKTRWINDPRGIHDNRMKLVQLEAAKRSGFKIPRTLVSTNAEEVRQFLQSLNGRAIFKPFNPHAWGKEGQSDYVSYASLITLDDLADPDAVRAAPGIYQEYIEKSYELRILKLGKSYLSAGIRPNGVNKDLVDWRGTGGYSVSPETLPEHLTQCLDKIASDLNFQTGSADIIVSKNNEFVFLEINESGQFLFLEQLCPALPILDAFSEFLVSGEEDFIYEETASGLTFEEYLNSSENTDRKNKVEKRGWYPGTEKLVDA